MEANETRAELKKKLERKAKRLTTNPMQYLAKTIIIMLKNDKSVLHRDNIMEKVMKMVANPVQERVTNSQEQQQQPRPA